MIKSTCSFSPPIKLFYKGVAQKTTSGALGDKQVFVNNIRVHVYLLWVAKFKFKQNAPLDILLCEPKLPVDWNFSNWLFSPPCAQWKPNVFERIQKSTRWTLAELFIGLAKTLPYVILEANCTINVWFYNVVEASSTVWIITI